VSRILKQLGSLVIAFVLTLITFGFGFASPAHAEYLVRYAQIINVQNTAGNGDNFAISVVGGTGPCTGRVIIFPKTGVSSPDVYERGYAIALAAMENNWNVDAFDYSGSDCRNGGQLSVTKVF